MPGTNKQLSVTGRPRKEGWIEKRSVSAPVMKNWRRRYLMLWDNYVCWYRDAPAVASGGGHAAGEMRIGPDTVVRRDASEPVLSISMGDRVLMLRANAEEIDEWNEAVMGAVVESRRAGTSRRISNASPRGVAAQIKRMPSALGQGRRASAAAEAAACDMAIPSPSPTVNMGATGGALGGASFGASTECFVDCGPSVRASGTDADGGWQCCVMSGGGSASTGLSASFEAEAWESSGVCPK